MENGWQDGNKSCPTVLPDAVTSSRFLCSFQGKFYPVNANVPFADKFKRILIHDIPESNEANRVHQIRSELLSSLSTKKFFQVDSQHQTREGKSWALVYEDKNYGGQQEDTELSSPFLVYTVNKDYSFDARRNEFEGEMATFESTAQAVSNRVSTETLDKHYEKRDNLTNGPAEKKRKEDALEDNHTGNRPKERESYWERRKKNNASAKKSREARKARELEAQMKAAFLERENLRMLAQLMIAQEENDCLKRVLCAKM